MKTVKKKPRNINIKKKQIIKTMKKKYNLNRFNSFVFILMIFFCYLIIKIN